MAVIQIQSLKEMSDTNPHIFLGDTNCMPDNSPTAFFLLFFFFHLFFIKKPQISQKAENLKIAIMILKP